MAINLYLAEKHEKDGFSGECRGSRLCTQWSFWGMTEIEVPPHRADRHVPATPPDKKKPEAVAEAQKACCLPFAVLNGALEGRDYLLGSSSPWPI